MTRLFALIMLSSTLTCLAFATAPRVAGARTWSVPGDADTIQAALNLATTGDTVTVGPGTYHELLQITRSVVLRGTAGSAATFLSGSGLPANGQALLTIATGDSATHVTGFTFEDRNDLTSFGAAIGVPFNEPPSAARIDFNRFRRNTAFYGAGIRFDWSGGTIEHNVFEDNSANFGGAVYASFLMSPVVVRYNSFTRNRATGYNDTIGLGGAVAIDDYYGPRSTIEGNVIWNNDSGYGAIGLYYAEATVRFNTIVLNHSSRIEPNRPAGIYIYGSSAVVSLVNNIIAWNSNGWGVGAFGNSQTTLTCNDFWHNDRGDVVGVESAGNLFSDPKLCDLMGENLQLGPGSPCLAANSGGCGLIGALDLGCATISGVEPERPTGSRLLTAVSLDGARRLRVVVDDAALNSEGGVTLSLFDVQGRLLLERTLGAAQTMVALAPDTSAPIASGLILIHVRSGTRRDCARIVLFH